MTLMMLGFLWCMWHKNDGDEQVELPSISFLGFSNAKGNHQRCLLSFLLRIFGCW
jgi:hypothetical protein